MLATLKLSIGQSYKRAAHQELEQKNALFHCLRIKRSGKNLAISHSAPQPFSSSTEALVIVLSLPVLGIL